MGYRRSFYITTPLAVLASLALAIALLPARESGIAGLPAPASRETNCGAAPLLFSNGPPNGVTGAPGDKLCANPECHSSFPPNVGGGSLTLTAPSAYFPADTHTIRIDLQHPGQIRWGFEITALDTNNLPVGTLLVDDQFRTQKSTITGSRRQYIKHTAPGTDSGVVDSAPGWQARWLAPIDYQGTVTFYAAGNTANGNSNSLGDFIHTDSLILALSTTGIRFIPSIILGAAPLEVNFTALPLESINSPQWDFGDGASSTLLNPDHTFAEPGVYSINFSAQSTHGPVSWTAQNLIAAHADTLYFCDTTITQSGAFSVAIRLNNFLPVSRMTAPINWSGDLPLDFQGIQTAGFRAEGMSVTVDSVDAAAGYTVVTLEDTTGTSIPPGAGDLFAVLFSTSGNGFQATISAGPVDTFPFEFTTAHGAYTPSVVPGSVSFACCLSPGDANHDDSFNIADITFSIARIFSAGPAPSCCAEADLNDDGAFNIADVTFGISHIFNGGPAPVCGTANGC